MQTIVNSKSRFFRLFFHFLSPGIFKGEALFFDKPFCIVKQFPFFHPFFLCKPTVFVLWKGE